MKNFDIAQEEFSLEGFQVVDSDMFNHTTWANGPMSNLYPTRLTFSKASLAALNYCESIRLEINPQKKLLLITPVSSKEKDAIKWLRGIKQQEPRALESKAFWKKLYEAWELERKYNYRATGKLIAPKGKVMIVFNFNDAEKWQSKNTEEER